MNEPALVSAHYMQARMSSSIFLVCPMENRHLDYSQLNALSLLLLLIVTLLFLLKGFDFLLLFRLLVVLRTSSRQEI